jgi:hypothetical protein
MTSAIRIRNVSQIMFIKMVMDSDRDGEWAMRSSANDNVIIFDPSLLVPPSHMLFKELCRDHHILLSPKMHDIIFIKEKRTDLQKLLKFWGARAEEIPLCIDWLSENRNKMPMERVDLNIEMREFRDQHINSPIRRYVDDPNLQFMNDELVQCVSELICLALQTQPNSVPIFCTETSSWKLVEIMKKSGAKIKGEIIEFTERKKLFFRENWKKVLSKAVGAAFVWVWGGPAAGLGNLGVNGITIVIEDP